MRMIDLTGQRFTRWLVESFAGTKKSGNGTIAMWNCLCDCGQRGIVSGYLLRSGTSKSCGCLRNELTSTRNRMDIKGNRYYKLVAEEFVGVDKRGHALWRCKCDCGNYVIESVSRLNSGGVKSCGCIHKEIVNAILAVDIKDKRFGKLIAKEPTDQRIGRKILWKCECDCGGETFATATDLQDGHVISCGCVSSKGEEAIGKILKSKSIRFKKNYKFEDLYTIGKSGRKSKLRFDFGVLNDNNDLIYLIEYQGIQHFYDKDWFGKQQRDITDPMKRKYCNENNIILYEITYENNIEEKLEGILRTHANPVGNASA